MIKKIEKILIIGSGISGCTLAEKYAKRGNLVEIIEKKDHIGGNCYDFYNKEGILVSKYGAHIFHTNYDDVWKYIKKFSNWCPYKHKVLSCVKNKLVPIPVNIDTVNILFNTKIKTERGMKNWLSKNIKKINNPQNSEESALARVGKELYELMFKNYTKKQWDLWPKELDVSVMNRIPVRKNFNNAYFDDKYQAIPQNGYNEVFNKMLSNKNIKIRLNTNYFNIKNNIKKYDKIFFTGPIDRFFNYKYGKLQYRCLKFKFETYNKEYFQQNSVINYPNDYAFIRIVEHKYLTGQKNNKTTISKDYTSWFGDPAYPVPTEKNKKIYEKYKKEAEKIESKNIYFVGRLANYKYFNMDEAFKNSLDLFNRLEKKDKQIQNDKNNKK